MATFQHHRQGYATSADAESQISAYAAVVRLLFVCLGNICRSPTAEGVMARLLADAGLSATIFVDSAGTGGWHAGELADPRTRAAAQRRGIDLTHRARQVTVEDFAAFDVIVAMDRNNREGLQRLAATAKGQARIVLLRNFEPNAGVDADVPDPYSGTAQDFEHVLDICQSACAGLLAHLQAELPKR
jgi:protein-tyrosine phosphatase